MLLDRSQIIHSDGKQMIGDTIFYDKQNGFGRIIRHIEMADTVQKMTLYGNYGEVYEKEKRGFVTDSAMMIDWSQKEKTYIHADTLFTEPIPYQVTVLVPKTAYWSIRLWWRRPPIPYTKTQLTANCAHSFTCVPTTRNISWCAIPWFTTEKTPSLPYTGNRFAGIRLTKYRPILSEPLSSTAASTIFTASGAPLQSNRKHRIILTN